MKTLEALIEEQKHDMLYGRRAWPEPGVVLSLDIALGDTGDDSLSDLLQLEDRGYAMPYSPRPKGQRLTDEGCTLHGNEDMYLSSRGRPVCRVCSRKYREDYRRRKGIKPSTRTVCPHGGEFRTVRRDNGKSFCSQCAKEYNARWYEANKDAINARRRAKNDSRREYQREYMRKYRARKAREREETLNHED